MGRRSSGWRKRRIERAGFEYFWQDEAGVGVNAGPLVIGYRHSVYARAVRIALAELGVAYDWQEADPFAGAVAAHPFRRVPVMLDGDVRIYETWAILTYARARWGVERGLAPPQAAREAQVASMAGAYVYWPLVRQVYAHAVFRPAMGESADPREVARGLAAADAVLESLEDLAREGEVLEGRVFGPADWILFPMIDAFRRAAEGGAMLAARPALANWWSALHERDQVRGTFARLEQGE